MYNTVRDSLRLRSTIQYGTVVPRNGFVFHSTWLLYVSDRCQRVLGIFVLRLSTVL